MTLQHVKFNLSLGKHATIQHICFLQDLNCLVLLKSGAGRVMLTLPFHSPLDWKAVDRLQLAGVLSVVQVNAVSLESCFPGGSRLEFVSMSSDAEKRTSFWLQQQYCMRSSNKNASSHKTFFWRL